MPNGFSRAGIRDPVQPPLDKPLSVSTRTRSLPIQSATLMRRSLHNPIRDLGASSTSAVGCQPNAHVVERQCAHFTGQFGLRRFGLALGRPIKSVQFACRP